MDEKMFEGKGLNEVLKQFGFIDVTGTTETKYIPGRVVDPPELIPVINPNGYCCWDLNNGIICVVDGFGHSWVISANILGKDQDDIALLKALSVKFALKEGCWVPHSNDGGRWAKQMWPWENSRKHILNQEGNFSLCGLSFPCTSSKGLNKHDPSICPRCKEKLPVSGQKNVRVTM